jgi:hypothetical protein
MSCYSYMGHRMLLMFHWSSSRDLFGIIHPEESCLMFLDLTFSPT